jgi:hypothetical protein
MTPRELRDAWLAARTVSAMRAVLADPAMTVAPADWAVFWTAYSPGTPPPRRSPATRFAAEQARAAEAALTAAMAASAGARIAVARTYTRSYWLDVYGGVERELVARRQARYLVSFTAPGWAADPNWRTSTVLALVQGMVGSGAFSAALILADALQDAGCDADEWLQLLRDPTQPWFVGARLLESLR